MNSPFEQSDELPVYVISVAAELSGMHPQTLREYERRGLVSPGRSGGGGRRYSMRDILALREIQRLSQDEGVNLSGIKLILSQLRDQPAGLFQFPELTHDQLDAGEVDALLLGQPLDLAQGQDVPHRVAPSAAAAAAW